MNQESAQFIAEQQKKINHLNNQLEDGLHKDRRPSTLRFKTLTGLVEYLYDNKDQVTPDDCVMVIESVYKVVLYSKVFGTKNDRHAIAISEPVSFQTLDAGRPLSTEEAIIQLQTRCLRTDDGLELIKSVSGMTYREDLSREDDGVKNDINLSSMVVYLNGKPPTVVSLIPFRVFPEVQQVESQYIVRVKSEGKQPSVTLMETDGGLWKVTAMEYIKQHLKSLTAENPVTIIG